MILNKLPQNKKLMSPMSKMRKRNPLVGNHMKMLHRNSIQRNRLMLETHNLWSRVSSEHKEKWIRKLI